MTERPLSTEAALELFLAQRVRGDAPDPDVFAARYPELGAELGSALKALLALECATREPEADVLPERIGAFRILRQIGRGGMGVVLEAIEEPLGRRVALKMIPAELLPSSSARARFRREAALASRLDHPSIATIFGAGVEDDRPWIAMRYVEGETLAQAISAARAAGAPCARLPGNALDSGARGSAGDTRAQVLALAQCIARVARALHSAHEQGVVHRDVKPSNIIVAQDGTPVLLDFGLAMADELEGPALTRTGETAGTPAYLAPELVGGEHTRHDEQCDVYSLGVTLHECVALRRPFDAPTPVALYRAILSSATPDLRAQRSVPRDLAVVVSTALERDRSRRYRSAAAFAEDLEACIAGRPIAARPVPPHGRLLRWARREPRQAALAGLLTLAILVAAVAAGTWFESRSEVRAAERLTNAERFEGDLRQGYIHLATNWNEEADQAFMRALAYRSDSPEAIAGRAFLRLKRGRDGEALEVLAAAPATPAFRTLRELASGKLPDADQGEEWFSNASAVEMFIDGMRLSKQIERTPPRERRRLAELALVRFEEAILRSWTTRMFYHVQRALAASRTGDEAAIRSAAAALGVLWPNDARASFTAGVALLSLDPQAAIPLLERAIELEPSWGAPNQNLGNAYLALKDYPRAERALQRAVEIDPKDADAFNSLGIVFDEQGCSDEARAAYLHALALRPMYETLANLAELDSRVGDPALAERELRHALGYDPRESQLRIPLARILHERGETRQALAEIETVVGFDPGNVGAWELLASYHAELGDPDLAGRAAEVARGLKAGR